MRAVVFDLFGTLIPSMSRAGFEGTLSSMARALSADEDEFKRQWIYETWHKRRSGEFPTVEANIEYICNILDLNASPDLVAGAAKARYSYARSLLMNPRDDSLSTLETLKRAGLKIGLLSNCSADVPYLWSETALSRLIDRPIFSCTSGLVKPTPESYHYVCSSLGVNPIESTYVGDGSDMELTGARNVGMHPVLLREKDSDPYDEQVDRKNWNGPTINRISGIVGIVLSRGN